MAQVYSFRSSIDLAPAGLTLRARCPAPQSTSRHPHTLHDEHPPPCRWLRWDESIGRCTTWGDMRGGAGTPQYYRMYENSPVPSHVVLGRRCDSDLAAV